MTDTSTTAAPSSPAPPPAAPFPWFAYILLALVCACVVAAGLALLFSSRGAEDPGTVSEVRPLASLGYSELDERAIRYFKRWKFRPNSVTEVRMPMVYTFSRR